MSKTILVVDDSNATRYVVATALRRAAFEVIEAVDGLDALAKLREHRVQLIVTDMNMPNMDGIALARAVRGGPTTRFLPIVMLTTSNRPEKMQEGKEAGVTAWLTKPFRPEQALFVIWKLISP